MCLICFADFWCIFTRRHQRGEKGELAEWFIRTTYNYVERKLRKIASGNRILENFITARKESVFYILSCTLSRNQLYSGKHGMNFCHINHKPGWICHQKPARTLELICRGPRETHLRPFPFR